MSTGTITIKDNHVPGFYGLVICGGSSSRMGTDKSLLTYHKVPQRYHLCEMLQPFCEQVFLSFNDVQVNDSSWQTLPDLPEYENCGPVAALLTAFTHFPDKDFLIAGCDYPFLKDRDIADLLSASKNCGTITFYNECEGLYEPLLGYYSCNDADALKEMHALRQYSLQTFLKMISAGNHEAFKV
jgi:molybdopterin-guanine dinucleotide biosynthesis protein A